MAQPQAAGHDGEGGVAIRAGVDGEDERVGRSGASRAGAGRVVAGVGREARRVHQRPDHRGLLRDIEMLAQARALALAQGDRRVRGSLHARVNRSLREADRHRRAIAVALQSDQPAGRLNGEIGGGALRPGPVCAVGRDRDVDQRGMLILELVVAQTARRHLARIARLDQHIRRRQQRQKVGAARVVVQIDHHAALAEAHRGPVERAVRLRLGERRQAPRGGPAGRLDLDHLRAHIRQHPAGHLSAQPGKIQNTDALQQGVAIGGHRSPPPGSRRMPRSDPPEEDSEGLREVVAPDAEQMLSWPGTCESSRRAPRTRAARPESTRAAAANPRAARLRCARGRSSARAAAAGESAASRRCWSRRPAAAEASCWACPTCVAV